ncbi:hypothetical protein CSUB_C0941 [Candidatus Caldarchaeum subterraneum]|uniref:Uncharacterized protein n=1 Tax=Caldiarchaeum subterraneum TaxID=311458 RepID=E6N6S0_CALS0|nr:hypothetical protein HGMM_F17C01C17 [Candidatus Caldarchaeum subterraneum]BAJ50795.1 hypothetical protein CSUB_C0941 [Candidatus Caldarchaeum subterraneum]
MACVEDELKVHAQNYSRLASLYKPDKLLLLSIARRGGVARHSDLLDTVGGKRSLGSTLTNRLYRLRDLCYINYGGGVASLKSKTPLCYVVGADVKYVYVGLLGRKLRLDIDEPEPVTAVNMLEAQGFRLERIVIATTKEAYSDWAFDIQRYRRYAIIDWKLVSVEQMNDIETMVNIMEPKVYELCREYVPIIDCTSGTRPAGIAFSEIADQLMAPLIYVYTNKELENYNDPVRIYWLKDVKKITEQLKIADLV